MVGISLLSDLWNIITQDEPINLLPFFSTMATIASFGAATSFASEDFFGYDFSLVFLYKI